PWRRAALAVVVWVFQSALGTLTDPSSSLAEETPAVDRAGLVLFETKIRPVLVEHCFECHSAAAARQGKLKGELRLDSRAAWERGGSGGPAIVAGKPDKSPLLEALRHEGLAMPPDRKLPAEVIQQFSDWIARGAPAPATLAADAADDAAAPGPRRGMNFDEARRFWAFQPAQAATSPNVRDHSWPLGPLDQHILAAIERAGLAPAPTAEPRALVRRLFFDLTGLPPSTEEVEEFLAACERDEYGTARVGVAVERTVERLLASPRFGERWGRHWLDVARYADSNGRDRNVYFHHAHRYRDYVIGAINSDIPYDQFVREQIAGDLLPAATPAEADRQRIATGFLALGGKAFEEAKPEVFRMDVIDEQMDTMGRAILGLSIGCARCHDHKFDPLPTADYYALAGVFRSTQLLYGYGPKGIKANVHTHSELLAVGPDAAERGPAGLAYLAELQRLTLAQNTARSDRYRVVRQVAAKRQELAAVSKADERAQRESEIAQLDERIKEWDVTVKAAEAALESAFNAAPPQPQWAMGARERPAAEDCRIHVRGETTNLGPVVARGVPRLLAQVFARTEVAQAAGSGRLQLAEWLTSGLNPLTPRVQVNRVWLKLFGGAIVATPDDFGATGAAPSHPELLGDLAHRFVRDGWSTKALVREMVLSQTYRQAALSDTGAADPDNKWFARMRPRRLEAESFRDAIKCFAGTLDSRPPADGAEFLAKHNPYREDEYRTFKPLFEPADIEHDRRSIYLPVVRGVLPPILGLFDFASPERTVALRDESTVPAQALFLLNNPWMERQARAAARRLLADSRFPDDQTRIDAAYRAALGRPPRLSERSRAAEFVAAALTATESAATGNKVARPVVSLAELTEDRWTGFCQALMASAEFRVVP
ncbi:MAG: PSD1 and planctomycete cytochrome C domain-containing protein, partial [Planctomycetota bacterium]